MAIVTLNNITKDYGDGSRPAVDRVSIEIADGEFMVLLGPSGCGKSTTLRMVAGLESISSGDLLIDGERMNSIPAKNRDIAMVFQSYALYPHMTVKDNLAFGLKRRNFAKAEIERRITEAAASLGLSDYLDRKPHALSGGQRQRVALGRAIVRDPKVFLFDEPLSNLDASLRVSTRSELIRLHERLGATMLYVTHDQVEAMTMGSRICIMRNGKVSQIGKPLDVYLNPSDTFVASFLGNPPMNLLPAVVSTEGVKLDGYTLPITAPAAEGCDVIFGIRPEDIVLVDPADQLSVIAGEVTALEPLGAETLVMVRTIHKEVIVRAGRLVNAKVGNKVGLSLDMAMARLFDHSTGKAIEKRILADHGSKLRA